VGFVGGGGKGGGGRERRVGSGGVESRGSGEVRGRARLWEGRRGANGRKRGGVSKGGGGGWGSSSGGGEELGD